MERFAGPVANQRPHVPPKRNQDSRNRWPGAAGEYRVSAYAAIGLCSNNASIEAAADGSRLNPLGGVTGRLR